MAVLELGFMAPRVSPLAEASVATLKVVWPFHFSLQRRPHLHYSYIYISIYMVLLLFLLKYLKEINYPPGTCVYI